MLANMMKDGGTKANHHYPPHEMVQVTLLMH